jgi:hypothetical protein
MSRPHAPTPPVADQCDGARAERAAFDVVRGVAAPAPLVLDFVKAEWICKRGTWKTREAVEITTLNGVSWFNHHRLVEGMGCIPPAEAEAHYCQQLSGQPASES